jgi:hypothetical protein
MWRASSRARGGLDGGELRAGCEGTPFGGSGYVALFEIMSDHEVAVSALRHQREDDYD